LYFLQHKYIFKNIDEVATTSQHKDNQATIDEVAITSQWWLHVW